MVLRRYLDGVEAKGANMPVGNRARAQTFTTEYRGQVNEDVLERAFELLCVQYPVLRGRITCDDAGYILYATTSRPARFTVLDGDEAALFAEVDQDWDISSGLAQLILVRGVERGFVGLRIDHAITDGRSHTAILGELWRLYSAIADDSVVPVRPGLSLPTAPHELLRQRWTGHHEPPAIPVPTTTSTPTLDGFRPAIHRRIHLGADDTQSLLDEAHGHRLSVHALICGAIVVALRRLQEPDPSVPMVCRSAVDLRDRVSPTVGATETTNFLGVHVATLTVPAEVNPIVVARQISAQLTAAIAQRDLIADVQRSVAVAAAHTAASAQPRLGQLLVTNLGVIDTFPEPSNMTITDFQILAPHQTRAISPMYVVHTYEGRLSIRASFPAELFQDDEVDSIVDHTATQLRNIREASKNLLVRPIMAVNRDEGRHRNE